MRAKTPRLLVIAGSDSSGGAGIQADLKTAQAFGVYAQTAVTAVTVQDTRQVHSVHPLAPDIVRAQIARNGPEFSAAAERIMRAVVDDGRVPPDIPRELQLVFPASAGPFLRSALTFDPAKAAAGLEVACLLVHGGSDTQVVPMADTVQQPAAGTLSPREYRARRRARAARPLSGMFLRWSLAGAALAMIAAILGIGVHWLASRPQVQQQYATGHGELRSLQLPDNTVVRLNTDSAIAVAIDRRRRRVEVLRGQAYFEVAKDPTRPFGVLIETPFVSA